MNIEEFISAKKTMLETEVPSAMLWNNIKKQHRAKVVVFNKKWLAIAATVIVAFVSILLLKNNQRSKNDVTGPGEVVIQKNDTNKKTGIDSTPQINGRDTQGLKQLTINDTNEITKRYQSEVVLNQGVAFNAIFNKANSIASNLITTASFGNKSRTLRCHKRNRNLLILVPDNLSNVTRFTVVSHNLYC